jgi:hypothetical protein
MEHKKSRKIPLGWKRLFLVYYLVGHSLFESNSSSLSGAGVNDIARFQFT